MYGGGNEMGRMYGVWRGYEIGQHISWSWEIKRDGYIAK